MTDRLLTAGEVAEWLSVLPFPQAADDLARPPRVLHYSRENFSSFGAAGCTLDARGGSPWGRHRRGRGPTAGQADGQEATRANHHLATLDATSELSTTASVSRAVHRSLASVLYPPRPFALNVHHRRRFRSSSAIGSIPLSGRALTLDDVVNLEDLWFGGEPDSNIGQDRP